MGHSICAQSAEIILSGGYKIRPYKTKGDKLCPKMKTAETTYHDLSGT